MKILNGVDPEWLKALESVREDIEKIELSLNGLTFNPSPENIFRALRTPLSEISVVIFGQDPYPNPNHAMGLAFSVPSNVRPLPPSLENIFLELHEDVGCAVPSSGDLTPWTKQGIALINRVLTVPKWRSGGHTTLGWQKITNEIARVLGEREVIAILWGNYAQQLAPYFKTGNVITSVHPSPLSAYRGFFGSKPFSKTNRLLASKNRRTIDWSLT